MSHPMAIEVYFVQMVVGMFYNAVMGLRSLALGFFGVMQCGHLFIGGIGRVWVVGREVGSNAGQEKGAGGGGDVGVGAKFVGFMIGKTHWRGR